LKTPIYPGSFDSVNVIRSLEEMGMGPYGQVMKEVKARACDFIFVDFAHENRSSNIDVYNLARSLISFVNVQICL